MYIIYDQYCSIDDVEGGLEIDKRSWKAVGLSPLWKAELEQFYHSNGGARMIKRGWSLECKSNS